MANNTREIINQVLKTDCDLNRFCLDHFRATYARFSDNMDRVFKVNLLLTLENENSVLEKILEERDGVQTRQNASQLSLDSRASIIERFDQLIADYRNSLDSYLLGIFDNLQEESMQRLRLAIANREVLLDEKECRYHFFIKTLRYYQDKQSEFTSLSLPSKAYFWNDFTLGAVQDFMHSGGKMTRIFIVDGDAEPAIEAHQIMTEQLKIGVNVYTTDRRGLSRKLRSAFPMVEHGKRIAWEVHVKEDTPEVKMIRVTTNRLRIAELAAELHHIHKIPYVPPAQSDDMR